LLDVPAVWWYDRTTDPQSTDMLELLALCGGMPKLLVPREVTSINGESGFLTTGEPLPPIVTSTTLAWLSTH
jgi:hypothetical protein